MVKLYVLLSCMNIRSTTGSSVISYYRVECFPICIEFHTVSTTSEDNYRYTTNCSSVPCKLEIRGCKRAAVDRSTEKACSDQRLKIQARQN